MTFKPVSLKIITANAAALADDKKIDPDAFALIRRNGFGASDSSVLLGCNPWNSILDLVRQKASTTVSDDERAIGKKPSVRMGADLEHVVLNKFIEWSEQAVSKPEPMYQIVEFPQLTVNFDGIVESSGIPVECKIVTQWAEKYWDHSRAMNDIESPPVHLARPVDRVTNDTMLGLAADCGIPIYYYTQCQQQILAANTEFCYLSALHVKDWTLRTYHVPRNEGVISKLKEEAYINWKKVESLRLNSNYKSVTKI